MSILSIMGILPLLLFIFNLPIVGLRFIISVLFGF